MSGIVLLALNALRTDRSEKSGWVLRMPERVRARPDEVFIDGFGWVRADGFRVSGWIQGSYFSFRPNMIDRWRLRRAVRAWSHSQPHTTKEG